MACRWTCALAQDVCHVWQAAGAEELHLYQTAELDHARLYGSARLWRALSLMQACLYSPLPAAATFVHSGMACRTRTINLQIRQFMAQCLPPVRALALHCIASNESPCPAM